MSEMLAQVAQAKEEAKAAVIRGASETDELPKGASQVEASEETAEVEETPAEETPKEAEGDATPEGVAAPEETIRIGGQTFKSQSEAFAYAERIEREKELTDAHAAGIREALEATRKPEPTAEPEDNFDERFYANPKETLKSLKAEATQEALTIIRAEHAREKMWGEFLDEHPDIRRKDAERILNEEWNTIGKMTDFKLATKKLAQKVRAEYEEIRGLGTPRTELSNKKQAVSPSGGAPKSVTPPKKEDRPLSFAEQVRMMKGNR